MSSFAFPPPPPPPPKQSTSGDASQYGSTRASPYASRGNRGGYMNRGNGRGFGSQEGRSIRGSYRGQGAPHTSQPRGVAGHSVGEKRTWSERHEHGRGNYGMNGQTGRTRTRAHAAVPPEVPSFGFSLPVQPVAPIQIPAVPATDTPSKDKANRKVNQLGLTPSGPEPVDSDPEVDEEMAAAAAQFVHSGALPNTNNKVEIAAWIAERKKRYPTKARQEAKTIANREAELERLKLKAIASRKAKPESATPPGSRDVGEKPNVDRQKEKLEKHLRKAEKLRQQLANRDLATSAVVISKPSLLGSNYDSEDSDADTGHLVSESPSSELSSEASESSNSSSSASSDDEAPEERSSRRTQPAQTPRAERPARAKEDLPAHLMQWVRKGFCKYHLQQKVCGLGPRCRYRHKIPQEVRDAKTPRMKLYDRMVAQEIERENMAAVNAIKALGAAGFFKS